MSRYWGYVQVIGGDWTIREGYSARTKTIDPALLPDWVKTKMAMLDFMSNNTRLPCESWVSRFEAAKSIAYFIYEDVSSAR